MRALLVDMQTLMLLQEVPCSTSSDKFSIFFIQRFTHHVCVVVQAAESTTGTPLFMGSNVVQKQDHCISTELETLMYVCTRVDIHTGGVLPWRHMGIDDHNLTSLKI